jgi:hypothetical protein
MNPLETQSYGGGYRPVSHAGGGSFADRLITFGGCFGRPLGGLCELRDRVHKSSLAYLTSPKEGV